LFEEDDRRFAPREALHRPRARASRSVLPQRPRRRRSSRGRPPPRLARAESAFALTCPRARGRRSSPEAETPFIDTGRDRRARPFGRSGDRLRRERLRRAATPKHRLECPSERERRDLAQALAERIEERATRDHLGSRVEGDESHRPDVVGIADLPDARPIWMLWHDVLEERERLLALPLRRHVAASSQEPDDVSCLVADRFSSRLEVPRMLPSGRMIRSGSRTLPPLRAQRARRAWCDRGPRDERGRETSRT